jgi:5-(carboxyamino)imidazole ribonucleotide synthase
MGLPLGSTDLLSPVVMMNLLGDVWPDARTTPDWSNILSISGTSLHIYGKREARIGRKMGHVSFLGNDQEEVLQKVNKAREFLKLPKL